MIAFIGNCQARFVSEAPSLDGVDHTHMTLFTPDLPNDPGVYRSRLSEDILNHVDQAEIDSMERENLLQNQPSMRDIEELAPTALVFNLFHMHDYCFNEQGGYAFYLNVFNYVNEDSGLVKWLSRNAVNRSPDNAAYYTDFLDMIRKVRSRFPLLPIIVLSRIRHYPAIHPRPFSYLGSWGRECFNLDGFFDALTGMKDVHVIEMDRVLAGMGREAADLTGLLPNLILNKNLVHPNITLNIDNDIEHPVPGLFDRMAKLVLGTVATGRVEYAPGENVPEWWHRKPDAPSLLPLERIDIMMRSGNDQSVSSAILHLFSRLPEDHTGLIVKNLDALPYYASVVTALKYYALVSANPGFIDFFEAYKESALDGMAGNSEFFRRKFVGELDKSIDYLKGLSRTPTGHPAEQEQAISLNGDPLFTHHVATTSLAAAIHQALRGYGDICIWGAGGRGRLLFDLIRQTPAGEAVTTFIDSNRELEGQTVEGVPIRHPDMLKERSPEAIVLSSTFEESIMLQIDSYGVDSAIIKLSDYLDQSFTPFIRPYEAIDIRFE